MSYARNGLRRLEKQFVQEKKLEWYGDNEFHLSVVNMSQKRV